MVHLLLLCALVCLLLAVQASESLNERKHLKSHIDEAAVDRLEAYLFPNRTFTELSYFQNRRLAINKPPYGGADAYYACTTCQNMKFCPILEKLLMQETYLPKDPNAQEVCKVVESLAERLGNEVFGHGRAFRDTPDCRNMVMQYMCLFYGGDSSQYRNYCLYREVVNSEGENDRKLIAKSPCRSYCVQVATVCANDPSFIHTCARIPCPPGNDLVGKQRECTPDPRMGGYGQEGNVLATNMGCDVPYYRTPYNAASTVYSTSAALLGASVLLAVVFLL